MERNSDCRIRIVGRAGMVLLLLCAAGCVGPSHTDTGAKVEKMPAMSKELTNLKQKYEGRIVAGNTGKDVQRYIEAMEELLAEWDPVGLTAEEVEYVLGPPSMVDREGELHYFFDSGRAGQGWAFELKDGKVVAVRILQGE